MARLVRPALHDDTTAAWHCPIQFGRNRQIVNDDVMVTAPAAAVERVAEGSEVIETPCGEGAMIWRRWPAPAAAAGIPPVVLMHGGFGSWTHWLRAIPRLREHMPVIACDLPGLGDSADMPKPHTTERIAAVVHRGLEFVLGPETPCRIAGFSFGGLIGSHVAALAGARCRMFIAVGSAGFGELHYIVDGLRMPTPEMSEAEVEALHRGNVALLMYHDPAKIDDLAVYVHRTNHARGRIRSRPMSLSDGLVQALPRIRGRLGGIWGEHDSTGGGVARIEARRDILRRHDPDAPFEIVPGAGHWVMDEAPEEFAKSLITMLDQA